MIYLIKSAGYGDDNKYIDLLKIGYTEDFKKDKRFNLYKLHNPTCKVLYEVLGGTEDQEKRIQYKFKDLLYPNYGREWFYYSEEIIDFFEDIQNNGLDIVLNLPKGASNKSTYLTYRNKIKDILYSIYGFYREENNISPKESLEDTIKDYYNKLTVDLGDKITVESEVLEYIKKDFGDILVNKYIENNKLFQSSQEISRFMEEFSKLDTFKERLRFFCNYKLSDIERNIILNQLGEHDNIRSYYLTLKPERLKALGYNKTYIERELGIVVFSKELLVRTIFQNFKIGDKISLLEIKNRLINLYLDINYKAVPKSTDLNEYFDTKEVKVTETLSDGVKKRIKALKLVGIKPYYQLEYNNLLVANNYIEQENSTESSESSLNN